MVRRLRTSRPEQGSRSRFGSPSSLKACPRSDDCGSNAFLLSSSVLRIVSPRDTRSLVPQVPTDRGDQGHLKSGLVLKWHRTWASDGLPAKFRPLTSTLTDCLGLAPLTTDVAPTCLPE